MGSYRICPCTVRTFLPLRKLRKLECLIIIHRRAEGKGNYCTHGDCLNSQNTCRNHLAIHYLQLQSTTCACKYTPDIYALNQPVLVPYPRVDYPLFFSLFLLFLPFLVACLVHLTPLPFHAHAFVFVMHFLCK